MRVRVNGLLVREQSLLLVKIESPVTKNVIWIPPGGGLEYGETMEQCLVREFKEETGLDVEAGHLRYINEMVKPPYHAIEFFFNVKEIGGKLELGSDPEHSDQNQILKNVRFISFDEFAGYDIFPEFVRDRFPREIDSGEYGIYFSREDF